MIVVVSGKMGSGKTALTDQIKLSIPNCHVVKFAGPLYESVTAALHVLEGYGLKPRKKDGKFLQWLGKYIRESERPDFWVNIGREQASKFEATSTPYVPVITLIDDCRFPNEFDVFPDAFKIRLECDRDMRKARADNWREDEFHDSEVSLDTYSQDGKFDFYIDTGKVNAQDTFKSVRTMMGEWTNYGRLPHNGDYKSMMDNWEGFGHVMHAVIGKKISTR